MAWRERDLEKYLVRRAEAEGAFLRKLRWIGMRNAPDRFLARRNGQKTFIELKKLGEPATKLQLDEHAAMRAAGLRVVVISTFMGVDELFTDM